MTEPSNEPFAQLWGDSPPKSPISKHNHNFPPRRKRVSATKRTTPAINLNRQHGHIDNIEISILEKPRMSRRLVNRGRSSGVPSSPASPRASATLPAYEPPSCPLNDSARKALGELSNNRDAGAYGTHLKDSVNYLGHSVIDLQERLRGQRDRLANLRRRRAEKGIDDKTPDEVRLETHLASLSENVNSLSRESEAAVRDLIDRRAELEDQATVLGDLYTAAVTQENAANATGSRRTRNSRTTAAAQQEHAEVAAEAQPDAVEDEDEDTKPPPPASTRDAFCERQAGKRSEFRQLTPYQRYAVNNDYANFKKLWHDAATPDDGPPLPDASRWFRADGEPVLPSAEDGQLEEDTGGDGSDDDIAVAREVISLRCPLSLRPLEEPYTNQKCKHTFEKSALLEYLPARGSVQCPQTGCSEVSRTVYVLQFC